MSSDLSFLGSSDPPGELDVLWHDGDTLGVNRAQVGVFEQANQVGFRRLLQCLNRVALEAQIGLEILSNLANQTLEGQFADEKFGGLLVSADLPQRHGTWPVAVRLLDTSRGRSALSGGLSRQLLSRRFATSGLAGGLLGSSHVLIVELSNGNDE